jgi:hypothetical protein
MIGEDLRWVAAGGGRARGAPEVARDAAHAGGSGEGRNRGRKRGGVQGR